MDKTGDTQAGAQLRRELARGDRALGSIPPVLGHLLAGSGHSLISDSIVAHLRGMLSDCAGQLLDAQGRASSLQPDPVESDEACERLAIGLAANSAVLSHCFAAAIEGALSEELERRGVSDQVLSPLMQELIASDDESVAELAMAAMTAQARWIQAHRRMGLPLAELPAEIFHEALKAWKAISRNADAAAMAQAEALLRAEYDESAGRLGLLTRLVAKLKSGAHAGLLVEHAGLALFASALASLSKQPRELVVLSCHPSQLTRLALGLRAAGAKPEEIAQQLLLIQPDFPFPEGFDQIGQAEAADLLGCSSFGPEQ